MLEKIKKKEIHRKKSYCIETCIRDGIVGKLFNAIRNTDNALLTTILLLKKAIMTVCINNTQRKHVIPLLVTVEPFFCWRSTSNFIPEFALSIIDSSSQFQRNTSCHKSWLTLTMDSIFPFGSAVCKSQPIESSVAHFIG